MKIVYVGPLWKGSTCLMRMRALQHIGHDIYPLDSSADKKGGLKLNSVLSRIANKLGYPLDEACINERIISATREFRPNIVWIDKGLNIWPQTLEAVREYVSNIVIAGYSPDDMGGRHNQSKYFLQSLPLYDIYFTTKSFNIQELAALGAKAPVFVGNAYDPETHRPISIDVHDRKALGGGVGFIGAWESDRAGYMMALARRGVRVRMWGWQGHRTWAVSHSNLQVEKQPVWGDDYARAICSFDINLCFLRKLNRDRQTTRSIEIPACGGFMLAERTEEHLELFVEGKEAEFFSSEDELIEKTVFYLKHNNARVKIAEAGRKRCLLSGYSYYERLEQMMSEIQSLMR